MVRAPGYIELLGDQSPLADGLVISAAINRGVYIASVPRSDGKIELVSSSNPEREIFWAGRTQPAGSQTWADGFKCVLAQIQRKGVGVAGFSAAIWDDFPSGHDFGRISAVDLAAALAIRQLFPFALAEGALAPPPKRNAKGELPPLNVKEQIQFAKLLQPSPDAGSHAGPGASTSLFGKAWHVVNLDHHLATFELSPMIGEVMVICEPDVAISEFAGTAPGMSDVPRNCALAAIKLGAKSLRSVELPQLKAAAAKLTPREYECASHVIGEFARVVGAERALRSEDHRQFGQFMFQSHESARTLLKNVSADANLLVELARACAGCLGARAFGAAPSADATVNLVSHHQAEEFMKHMSGQYQVRTGRKLRTFVLQIADGAG